MQKNSYLRTRKKCLNMRTTILNRRFPSIVDMGIMLLLFFVSQLLFSLILAAFGFVLPATSAIDAVDVETYMNEQVALAHYTAIVYPLSFLFSIGLLWLYVRLRGGKKAIHIRHSAAGFNPTMVLFGVVWLMAAQIVLEPLMSVLPSSESRGLGRGIWACLTAVCSAAILEELLCRGLIFETLHKRWGVKTSILFSSLFFGLMHLDFATMIVAVVAGVIFGILYVRTSSLYTTIIIHAINNAMAFAMICFGVGDMSLRDIVGGGVPYYVAYGVATLIFVVFFVESYFKVFRGRTNLEKS